MYFIRAIVMALFCILLSFVTKAQELAQLTKSLEQAKSSEERFYALVKLSDYWSYQDTVKAKEMLQQALPLAAGNDYLKGIYLFYEAGIYYGYDNAKSQRLYLQAETYLKKKESPEAYRFRARLWHNYGAMEQQADNDKALLDITLQHCIPYAIKAKDDNLLIGYFTDVGMVFFNYKEYGNALEYYNKAVSLARMSKEENESLLWTYLNMFEVYFQQKEEEKCQDILQNAEVLLGKNSEKKLAGLFYKNKAKLLNVEGKYQEALQSIEDGQRIANKYNFYWDNNYLKYEKAQIYKNSGDWQLAKKELDDLLKDSIGSSLSKNRLAMIIELSEVEANLGNYNRAYALTRDYKTMNDSLAALDFKRQMTEMETRYRTKEKEQEIALLKSQNLLNRTIVFAVCILSVLLSLWFLYAWNGRKKRDRREAILLRQQRDIEVSEALMDGEEQERKRMARELHDGLVGHVTGLKMSIERIAIEREQQELDVVIDGLGSVITELRHTAHNLEPIVLTNQGLDEAIRYFCKYMESPKYNLSIYTNGLNEISDKRLQLSMYRIVQELITNAVKHAEASEIMVQCSLENNLILIEVEDNGKGFDVNTTTKNLGLNSLESRTKSIGGVLNIDSKMDEGTHIEIVCQL